MSGPPSAARLREIPEPLGAWAGCSEHHAAIQVGAKTGAGLSET